MVSLINLKFSEFNLSYVFLFFERRYISELSVLNNKCFAISMNRLLGIAKEMFGSN